MNYTINTFLLTTTSSRWLEAALANIPLLLVDHAHCEKKAAATALSFIYRYCDKPALLAIMSKLAREELRHFEQVLSLIEQRGEQFYHLPPSNYAKALHQSIKTHEPCKLIDTLIVGALIEARSCERFQLLADYLECDELSAFYRKLYLAEARHFLTYLNLAAEFAQENIEDRIQFFGELEANLIQGNDEVIRFHSGMPPSPYPLPEGEGINIPSPSGRG
jgi:tRNA-(ms[2]io[6]A)-hydroxylase